MSMEPTARSGRRAILAGAVAGAAARAAGRLIEPDAASAAGGSVLMDTANLSTAETSITCSNGSGIGGFAQNVGHGVWGATNDPASAGVYGAAYLPATAAVAAHHNDAAGIGLRVTGRTVFNRSGRATVATGKASVDITVVGGLAGTPLILANLMSYRAGVAVAAVRPNYPSAGKARLYLTKAVASATYVAWFVVR